MNWSLQKKKKDTYDEKQPELCFVKAELKKGNSMMIQSVYLSTKYVNVLQTKGFRGRLAVRSITKRGTCGASQCQEQQLSAWKAHLGAYTWR
jgi:hypothetical protein